MAFLIDEEQIKEWANNINMEYIDRFYDENKKHTYVRVICHKHDYKGIQILDVDRFRRWSKKGKCMCDFWNRDTEDLKRDPGLNPSVEIIGKYIKSSIKIKCKCRKCGNEWEVTPNKLQQGEGCPLCRWDTISIKNRLTEEEVISRLNKNQQNLELLSSYKNMSTKIKYRCKICGYIGESYPYKILSGETSCKRCSSSKGERIVARWLDDNNIPYKTEYIFNDCRNIAPLRFDFYLYNLNICIEYQGEQHYRPVRFNNSDVNIITQYENQIKKDNIKRIYCLQNDIQLIEIPYWEIDNIDTFLRNKLKY